MAANPALDRGLRKGGRALLQMTAAGSLTVLVDLLAHGLSPATAGVVLAVWGVLVTFLHNYLETKGVIPAILPAAGLITTTAGGAISKVVGTVDAVTGTQVTQTVGDAVQGTTQVVGQVLDTAGQLIGSVGGTAQGLLTGALGTVLPPDVENKGGV